MATNDGGRAFPRPASAEETTLGGHANVSQPGMSLRDWFAGQALVGFIGRGDHPDPFPWIAKAAFDAADAMLEARK